jgi:sigma-E factor negative regulatory protein RseA
MSEQIREQISAFLDGELPSAESELLLRRMLRDAQLRDSFGRYALIGEAMRGMKTMSLTRDLTGAINGAIDGEPSKTAGKAPADPGGRWWLRLAGAAVAAGVAIVAVVALQQRTIAPQMAVLTPAPATVPVKAITAATQTPTAARNHEGFSYTVPNNSGAAPNAIPGTVLTSYVFAHSQYPSLLGQRDVMTDIIAEADQANPENDASVVR